MFALYFHKSIALETYQNMEFLIRPSLGSGKDYNVYLSVCFSFSLAIAMWFLCGYRC